MKNDNGFTLIELLAVVVIIGLLMAIAIPAVTSYIDNSKKDLYIDNAKKYIEAAAVGISHGDYPVHDQNTTYYIHINNIKVEKDGKSSPYAEWKDAYVVVTINDDNTYNYYWTSVDYSGHRINLTNEKDLKRKSIIVESESSEIVPVLIDEKTKLVIYDSDGNRINK